MKLTWFGHSAFRVDIAGAAIMIDPFINNPTFDGEVKAAYHGATHVVLTHGHDDHIGQTVEICKATNATLVANFEVCHYLQSKGVENISAVRTKSIDSTPSDAITTVRVVACATPSGVACVS